MGEVLDEAMKPVRKQHIHKPKVNQLKEWTFTITSAAKSQNNSDDCDAENIEDKSSYRVQENPSATEPSEANYYPDSNTPRL